MLRRIREQLPESRLVILYRFELDTGILRLPLVYEVFLKNPLLQISSFRHNDTLIHQVIHGKKQQRNCRKTLLAINDQELLIMSIRIINRNKTPEKVTLPVPLDDLYKIIIQLLAVFGFPVIVSLINRNDKPLVRTLHVFNEFAF